MDISKAGRYVTRDYRFLHEASDLCYFKVQLKESDLAVGVDRNSYRDVLFDLCRKELIRLRGELEDYISMHPEFRTSLLPLQLSPRAPHIASEMAAAAAAAGVGPMAAVAGAFAQAVGEMLAGYADEVIVENGGDIYLSSSRDRIIAVFAGESSFSYKIGIKINAGEGPVGVCTSSGTVGPSLSFGTADAVVVKGMPVALADAAATGAGNLVKSEADLLKAIDYVKNIPGISGILIIKNNKMALWGEIEIIPIKRGKQQ
ncbi:MAG: UPF0280 family protein [Syntrophomonadaceae bacterium]|nr:UPF0280 family protein [Syntrophomonadaceae bacterium]